jgi:transcriptional regulator with XRE-family HTH domain
MKDANRSFGTILRTWRQRRRLTQLDLALDADISPRHLSFLETGRAQPSRRMLLHLSEELEIPLRDRNTLLVAAGFAPIFPERRLDDTELSVARQAIDTMLEAQKPLPRVRARPSLEHRRFEPRTAGALRGRRARAARPPVNGLRLTLHPRGMAPRIENLAEWRAHLARAVRHQIDVAPDPVLEGLLQEMLGYPGGDDPEAHDHAERAVLLPLRIRTSSGCCRSSARRRCSGRRWR